MIFRRIITFSTVFALILTATRPTAAAPRQSYDPAVIYPGPYEPEQLFYRNPKGLVWLRWSEAGFTRSVKCRETLKGLKLTGTWQGHLKANGACGTPEEPSLWALGNWINFDLLNTPRDER